MKKRKTLLSIALIAAAATCFAQKTVTDTLAGPSFTKNEMGLDMIFFLNLFRNQFEPSNNTQLIINYDRWISPRNALRFTWGIGYSSSKSKQDTLSELSSGNSNNMFRLGIKHEERVSKYWLFYYGVDGVFEYDYSTYQQAGSSKDIATFTETNKYYGLAPFMGVRLEVNPRLSFTTETQISMLFLEKQSREEHNIIPSQNKSATTSGFNLAYIIPQNIFLKIKF